MREELDGRMWADNHDSFGRWVDGAIGTIRAGLTRFAQWDGSTHQLLAVIAAFVITGLTFNATTAA